MLLFVLSSNFLSISQLLLFVNNFFIFLLNFLKFVAAVFSGELYNIKPSNKCQQFFSIFLFFRFYSFFPVLYCFSILFVSASFLIFPLLNPPGSLLSLMILFFLRSFFYIIFYRNNRCCTFS